MICNPQAQSRNAECLYRYTWYKQQLSVGLTFQWELKDTLPLLHSMEPCELHKSDKDKRHVIALPCTCWDTLFGPFHKWGQVAFQQRLSEWKYSCKDGIEWDLASMLGSDKVYRTTAHAFDNSSVALLTTRSRVTVTYSKWAWEVLIWLTRINGVCQSTAK